MGFKWYSVRLVSVAVKLHSRPKASPLEASPHVCQCGAKGSKTDLFPVLDAISHHLPQHKDKARLCS